MTTRKLLESELAKAPEPLLNEVLDFLHFLRTKKHMNTAIASESSLEKDWLTSEEDKAWQNL
jgi:hypothetical protein